MSSVAPSALFRPPLLRGRSSRSSFFSDLCALSLSFGSSAGRRALSELVRRDRVGRRMPLGSSEALRARHDVRDAPRLGLCAGAGFRPRWLHQASLYKADQ